MSDASLPITVTRHLFASAMHISSPVRSLPGDNVRDRDAQQRHQAFQTLAVADPVAGIGIGATKFGIFFESDHMVDVRGNDIAELAVARLDDVGDEFSIRSVIELDIEPSYCALSVATGRSLVCMGLLGTQKLLQNAVSSSDIGHHTWVH